jgi:phage-related protein
MNPPDRKPLYWIASSRKDLKAMPERVRKNVGTALLDVQHGEKPADARPLRGFGGAGVLEIVDDYQTDTYRAVYTVDFPGAVYVLHAFQKKAKHGIVTPRREVDLIRSRYGLARQHHATLREQGEGEHHG